jgi:hypothetical protein
MAKVFELNAEYGFRDLVTGTIPDVATCDIKKDSRGAFFRNDLRNGHIKFTSNLTFNFSNIFWYECVFYAQGDPDNSYCVIFENAGYNNGAIDAFGLNYRSNNDVFYQNGAYIDNTWYANNTTGVATYGGFGKIHHFVVEYRKDIKTMYFYLNGFLYNTKVLTQAIKMPNSGYKKFMGYLSNNPQKQYIQIAYVRMYDTPQDAVELYRKALPIIGVSNNKPIYY